MGTGAWEHFEKWQSQGGPITGLTHDEDLPMHHSGFLCRIYVM